MLKTNEEDIINKEVVFSEIPFLKSGILYLFNHSNLVFGNLFLQNFAKNNEFSCMIIVLLSPKSSVGFCIFPIAYNQLLQSDVKTLKFGVIAKNFGYLDSDLNEEYPIELGLGLDDDEEKDDGAKDEEVEENVEEDAAMEQVD